MPFTWWISRLCEEFHCLPSAAWREMETVHEGLLVEIVEARAFANTLQAYKAAAKDADRPKGPMGELVKAIEFDLVKAQIEKANG